MFTEPPIRQVTLDLEAINSAIVPKGTKGLPPAAAGQMASAVKLNGYNLLNDDIPLPACVLHRTALTHNRNTMREFTERMGVQLAPHGKTTMAPQLFAEQLEDGAWGMTAATPAQLFAYRSVNVSKILYANQLVDPGTITFVLEELEKDSHFEFVCLVDSLIGVRILAEAVRAFRPSRPLDVLVEIGIPGARTGVRRSEEAVNLGVHVASMSPYLRLRGIEAFEGVIPVESNAALETVKKLLDDVLMTFTALNADNLFGAIPPIVSVGGSAYFGMVVEHLRSLPVSAQIILRSGCYLTNDHGMYASVQKSESDNGRLPLTAPFQSAIEVWAYVQSRPEPSLAIVALGKRDISHDIDMPVPIKWVKRGSREVHLLGRELQVLSLNDQHARVSLPDAHPLQVGDRIALGCSHPCTTFDKWRSILMVDDSYRVIDVISTLF